MEIIPLAAESLGVRSMATLVRTKDISLVIDPGARLGPSRYGLRPHRLEIGRRSQLWKDVKDAVRRSSVLTVSHYHHDHHEPKAPFIYDGKVVLLKHPKENINKSQTARAARFMKLIKGRAREIHIADDNQYDFGNANLCFSKAVPHGTDDRLGYVVQLAVTEGDHTFVHSSDVEGPSLKKQSRFLFELQPRTAVIDGPMTYQMHRYGRHALETSIKNLVRLVSDTPIKTLILEHHLLRDLKWREKMVDVIKAGEEHGCAVQSFAEYGGRKEELLEGLRKQLHEGDK